jgi:hypothetical protein
VRDRLLTGVVPAALQAKATRWSLACSYPAFPEPLFRLDLTGHCAEGGGNEVLMQITRSVSAKIRKWLGLLGKRSAKTPYGAGAAGR